MYRKAKGPTVSPSQRHSGLEHTRIFKGSEPCQIQGSPYKKAIIYSECRNPVLTITYRPEQHKSSVLKLPSGLYCLLISPRVRISENETISNQLAGTEILPITLLGRVLLNRELCSRSTQDISLVYLDNSPVLTD